MQLAYFILLHLVSVTLLTGHLVWRTCTALPDISIPRWTFLVSSRIQLIHIIIQIQHIQTYLHCVSYPCWISCVWRLQTFALNLVFVLLPWIATGWESVWKSHSSQMSQGTPGHFCENRIHSECHCDSQLSTMEYSSIVQFTYCLASTVRERLGICGKPHSSQMSHNITHWVFQYCRVRGCSHRAFLSRGPNPSYIDPLS